MDDDSINLLHEAIVWNNSEVALDLISRRINVNQQDNKGMTPLQYALHWKRWDLARAIIETGADVNIRDSYGNNALWTAVFNSRGNYEFVKLILEKGGDVFTKNKAGRSPLDFARQINDKKLVDLLNSVT